jgi:AAA+ superfamily predicted ATPase
MASPPAKTSNQSLNASSGSDSFSEAKKEGPSRLSWNSTTTLSSLSTSLSNIGTSNASTLKALTEADTSTPAETQFSAGQIASGNKIDRRLPAYPVVEIERMDLGKQQALDALVHIEKKQANRPNLLPASLAPQVESASMPGSASILTYIHNLERKLEALENLASTNRQDIDRNRQDIDRSQVALAQEQEPKPLELPRPKPWIVEIKRYKKLNYRFGSAQLYDDSETVEAIRARESSARGGGYVLNVYREYDWEGNALNSKLEVCSTLLLELIRDLIKHYPGPEFDLLRWEESAGDTVTFSEPYMMLFTHRSEMNQSLNRTDIPEETKSHLKLLLRFLREEMPRTSAKLDEIEAGSCKKITFQDLWLLYTPNTPVYLAVDAKDRQMVVYSRNVPEKNVKGQWGVLSLYCWSAQYQGEKLVRIFSQRVIQPFTGEKALHHLDLVPMQYLPDHDAVRARLIARGHRYVVLNKTAALQDYHGDVFPRVFKDEPIRVVVDQDTYWQKQGTAGPRHDDPSEEYGFPEGEESLEDEHGNALERALVCCYPKVGVFSLRDKEWASVRVDHLRPVQFRDKAFKRLVIKEEYKKMMIAMVEAYMLEQPGFSDIVTGKGRGLVVLLHGPPGVGKTLAAECISERQKRPLYSVSCGELGTEPMDLERRLKEVFSYAVLWKAILLMDEADIFLHERDTHDVRRSALVSIFLRELEYFDGILFLTTNRPGDIDEAFQSRIHVSIGLKALNVEERRQVWAVFIRDMALSDKEKRALLEYVTQNFDEDKLNGRQIRNAVRTSLALAQLKREKLNAGHLERVIKIGREFAGYMEDLNKMNAEEYAIALGRRAPAR